MTAENRRPGVDTGTATTESRQARSDSTAGNRQTDTAARVRSADYPADAGRRPRGAALSELHATFRRWLGDDYDTGALDALVAAVAVERLDGDPLWLLLVSGSGNAKTETVQAALGAGALLVSTITSEGALLSATSKSERTPDASGGLLREVGARGVLVIKDVTSILAMDRTARGQVLGALREVYDGNWFRRVGTDGGRVLTWEGRVAVIGAVTTAWDAAHAVIAAMGDRFVLVRMDSTSGREAAGRQAIRNTGLEPQMRVELAEAFGRLIACIGAPAVLTEDEMDALLAAANVVTLARTAVERDYRGDVVSAHAPEMPTRFAKQLAQIVRGATAAGLAREDALALAVRCARDSMPPLRLAVIDDLAAHPGSAVKDVRKRLAKPRTTVDRELQALHMLGVLDCEEEDGVYHGKEVTIWRYRLAAGIEPGALLSPNRSSRIVATPTQDTEKASARASANNSGASNPPVGSGGVRADNPLASRAHEPGVHERTGEVRGWPVAVPGGALESAGSVEPVGDEASLFDLSRPHAGEGSRGTA